VREIGTREDQQKSFRNELNPDPDELRASEGLPGNSQAPDLDAIRATVRQQSAP
jgi:hypothetical protein